MPDFRVNTSNQGACWADLIHHRIVDILMVVVSRLAASDPDDSRRPTTDLEAASRLAWESWQCLDLLAEVGEVDTENRHAWDILVRVHGFPAVLCAVARCYWLVAHRGRVTCDQAKDVLDGNLRRALRDTRGNPQGMVQFVRPSPKLTGRAAVRFSDLLGLTFNRQEPL